VPQATSHPTFWRRSWLIPHFHEVNQVYGLICSAKINEVIFGMTYEIHEVSIKKSTNLGIYQTRSLYTGGRESVFLMYIYIQQRTSYIGEFCSSDFVNEVNISKKRRYPVLADDFVVTSLTSPTLIVISSAGMLTTRSFRSSVSVCMFANPFWLFLRQVFWPDKPSACVVPSLDFEFDDNPTDIDLFPVS
jgi:hypothetical protein